MKYMGAYGTCKYCGNPRFVMKAPTDATQSEIDAIATDECDCEKAEFERTVRELRGKASSSIAKIVQKTSREAAAVLEMAAESVARGTITKVTIVIDGMNTVVMYKKNERIIVQKTKKEVTFADGELEDGPVTTRPSTQQGDPRRDDDMEAAE